MIEAISLAEAITGMAIDYRYSDDNRVGDHVWWISSTRRFTEHYPEWTRRYDLRGTLEQMLEGQMARWV